eukprot:scaffold26495_cov103-Cylindrotheca_fusiformis.AAC.4
MSETGKTRVVQPADVDILLGRGKPFQNHPGNQRMLALVDKYRDRYQQAERKEKHDIVEEVMGIISGSGGRFLRRVDYENYWVEVKHPISYRKVGHAFRSKARKSDSASKAFPPMTRQRIEASPTKKSSAMEEMLLADLRMRRAAMHQAELMNMSNLGHFGGATPLDRFLLPQSAMSFGSGLFGGLGGGGGLMGGGLMNPEHLLRQQSLLANSSLLSSNMMNRPNDVPSKGPTGGQALPAGFVP